MDFNDKYLTTIGLVCFGAGDDFEAFGYQRPGSTLVDVKAPMVYLFDDHADVFETNDDTSVHSRVQTVVELHEVLEELGRPVQPATTRVLGHNFVPMTRTDRYAFCDAPAETLICYLPDGRTTLLYTPSTREVEEHIFTENEDGSDNLEAHLWKAERLA